jgi:hypothetical protein
VSILIPSRRVLNALSSPERQIRFQR